MGKVTDAWERVTDVWERVNDAWGNKMMQGKSN